VLAIAHKIWCNKDIGGFYQNLFKVARFLMGPKNVALTMQFIGATNKTGKPGYFYTKTQSGGKTAQIRPSPDQNRSESQCSCIFQKPMNRGKYAYMGL